MALSAAVAITACGGDDDDAGSDDSAAAEASSTAAGTDATAGTEATDGTEATEATAADTAGSAAPADTGGGGGRLVVAFPAEPDDLDEYVSEQRFEGTQVLDTIVVRTPDGEFLPGLAAELPVALDPEATTWQVTLRDGVLWHDGEPLDADSFIDAFQYVAGVEGISELKGAIGFTELESLEKVDDLTVTIKFAAPHPLFLTQASYMKVQKNNPDRAENIIGTGPYRLVSWDRGRSITLEKFDDYWTPTRRGRSTRSRSCTSQTQLPVSPH